MTEDCKIVAFVNRSDKDVDNLKELYLPNPRSSIRSVYLYNDKGRLYEVQKVSNGRSSWLLDSHLYKDGGVRFITPVDPLLIALPIFQNAFQQDKNEFKTLDDILCRQNVKIDYPELDEDLTPEILEQKRAQPLDVHRLINISGFIEQLAHICDMQEIAPAFFAYRLNEKSVLTWLEKKVDRLLNNPTFKAYFTENEDENTVKLEAVYTLSNYLNRQWFEKLLDKLQLKDVQDSNSMEDITNYVTDASPSSFFKRTHPDEVETKSVKKKRPDVPRSLAKVNTSGMKSITSFFAKKQ